MSMSPTDKHLHLESTLCPLGHVASPAIADRMEKLFDANRDGVLSCDEFANSHLESALPHVPASNHSAYMASLAECTPAGHTTTLAAKGALQPDKDIPPEVYREYSEPK